MQPILEMPLEYNPLNYSVSFCNWAEDVNRDGWTDFIVVDFPGKQTWWYENPQTAAGPWKRHVCVEVTNNESPTFLDLDGDGRRELIFGTNSDSKQVRRSRAADGHRTAASQHAMGRANHLRQGERMARSAISHGLGVGDVNKDGFNDIFVAQGWWQNPARNQRTKNHRTNGSFMR